jgi:hypothetical protein
MSAAGKLPRWIVVIAIVLIFAIVDEWLGTLWGWTMADRSNAMHWLVATLFLEIPQTVAAAVIGWLAARDLPVSWRNACMVGAGIFMCRLMTRWYLGSVYYSFSSPLFAALAADTLPMLATFAAAYVTTSRLRAHMMPGPPMAPAIAVAFVLLTVAEVFLLPYVVNALLVAWASIPRALAPAWLCAVPAVPYTAAGYACARHGWMVRSGAALCVTYACVLHVGVWAYYAGTGDSGFALAVTWIPTAAIPVWFAMGWWSARRRKTTTFRAA